MNRLFLQNKANKSFGLNVDSGRRLIVGVFSRVLWPGMFVSFGGTLCMRSTVARC